MITTLDLHAIRSQFPALAMQIDGQPAVFLDNPGGTQVPQAVIDAMTGWAPPRPTRSFLALP